MKSRKASLIKYHTIYDFENEFPFINFRIPKGTEPLFRCPGYDGCAKCWRHEVHGHGEGMNCQKVCHVQCELAGFHAPKDFDYNKG